MSKTGRASRPQEDGAPTTASAPTLSVEVAPVADLELGLDPMMAPWCGPIGPSQGRLTAPTQTPSESGEEPLRVDHDPGDLAGARPPRRCPSDDVPGGDGEAVQPPVDVRRRRRSPRPRGPRCWRPGARARPGCRRSCRPRERGRDRRAGGGLAPRQQARVPSTGRSAGAEGRRGVGGGDGERSVALSSSASPGLQVEAEGEQGDARAAGYQSSSGARVKPSRS